MAPNSAPGNLRGSARAGGATRLVFQDNTANEDVFVIQRKVAGSADPFTQIGTRAGTTFGTSGATLTFDDTTAVTGTQYTYRVLARNTGGDSAPSNEFTLRAGGQGGTGLRGTLYDNDDFTGTTVTKLMDADENWGSGQPDPGIGADNFTTVLQGQLQAEFSEPYTFYTASDDGVAIRVFNLTTGELLINYDNIGAARGISAAGTFQDNAGTANPRRRSEVRHRSPPPRADRRRGLPLRLEQPVHPAGGHPDRPAVPGGFHRRAAGPDERPGVRPGRPERHRHLPRHRVLGNRLLDRALDQRDHRVRRGRHGRRQQRPDRQHAHGDRPVGGGTGHDVLLPRPRPRRDRGPELALQPDG